MTEALFRSDAYQRSCTAKITAVEPGLVLLDRTVFYPTGGGQPGDTGYLRRTDGALISVIDTKKAPQPGDIWHVIADDSAVLSTNDTVEAVIDWDRRYRHMRMHSCLHLISSLVKGEISGAQIGDGKGRIDFNIPDLPIDKTELAQSLNNVIQQGHPVTTRWIANHELQAQPELIRTLSVAPPVGQGQIRLLAIGDLDLQPCGGTHIANTTEIGLVEIPKIENKGRQNRRIHVVLASPGNG